MLSSARQLWSLAWCICCLYPCFPVRRHSTNPWQNVYKIITANFLVVHLNGRRTFGDANAALICRLRCAQDLLPHLRDQQFTHAATWTELSGTFWQLTWLSWKPVCLYIRQTFCLLPTTIISLHNILWQDTLSLSLKEHTEHTQHARKRHQTT